METMETVLEKQDILHDVKARRVLNTSGKDSGITLKELEDGVTIETIEALQVPVYLYGGQLTIHGTFKDDIGENFRVAGYKSVFKNGNGSIGVRYVAIDAAKKIKLLEMSRLSEIWYVNIDSRGCQAHKTFRDKAQAIECYRNAPDMFVGSKQIYQSIYGNFFVVLEIGAIYEKDFYALAKALTGLDEETFKQRKAEKDKKRTEEKAVWEAEYKEELAKLEIRKQENKVWREERVKELETKFESCEFSGAGLYVYPFASERDADKKGFMLLKVKKGAFGKLYASQKLVKNISEIADFVPDLKAKVIDDMRTKILKAKKMFRV
jgi:hypothetical protein